MIQRMAVAAGLVLLALGASSARAQACDPGVVSTDYAIFLDDFRLVDATAPAAVKSLVSSLQTSAHNHLDALALETHPSVRVVDCPGRFPKPDYFVQSPVEWMNNRKVVMELWSIVRQADETHYDADFFVVIIPARLLELQYSQPQGLFRIAHRLPQQNRESALTAIFQHHRELTGYAFIGAGLRAMREKQYDYATAYLCRGSSELRKAPVTAANQQLLQYAEASTNSVVAQAKSDAHYVGALKLVGTGGACAP